jgi:hypothetical protein
MGPVQPSLKLLDLFLQFCRRRPRPRLRVVRLTQADVPPGGISTPLGSRRCDAYRKLGKIRGNLGTKRLLSI